MGFSDYAIIGDFSSFFDLQNFERQLDVLRGRLPKRMKIRPLRPLFPRVLPRVARSNC